MEVTLTAVKKLSTSALSRKLEIPTRDLFEELLDQKLIYRKDDSWHLTKKGTEYGGETVSSKNYGDFIVWPPDLDPFDLDVSERTELVNATEIGKALNLSNQRVNLILSEIGWLEKTRKGWSVTSQGRKIGGQQLESQSGNTYAKWPEGILRNKTFLRSISGEEAAQLDNQVETTIPEAQSFRDKYPASIRTKDGHNVRSRGELIIDNALYDYGLVHAYERRLPIEEEVYSDFYIPAKHGGKAVYLEYWGLEDEEYQKRKEVKRSIYKEHGFYLIEITNSHIENLDDYLPKELRRYDIFVE